MTAKNSTSSALLKGCGAGCLAVILLALVLGFAGWLTFRNAVVEVGESLPQQFERPLPSLSEPTEAPSETGATTPESPAMAGAGRLVLDLSMGRFEVHPLPAGEPLRVESRFDPDRFTLTESYEARDDGQWTQRVKFGAKSRIRFGSVEAGDNLVQVYVPAGHPFALEAEIKIGESVLDLSGLEPTRITLELSMGQHELRFASATTQPVERIRVDGRMGEVTLRGLGFASPAQVHAEHAMGELVVDARGSWQRDSAIRLDAKMGPIRLDVPDDVALALPGTTVKLGSRQADSRPDPPAGAPTLTVRTSVTMGELRVRTVPGAASATADPEPDV